MEVKKPEVKTVDFDVQKTDGLLNLANILVGFPAYTNIRDATHRQLRKIEQTLEEALEKIREEEKAEELKARAEAAAKAKAEEAKSVSPHGSAQYPTEADAAKMGGRK